MNLFFTCAGFGFSRTLLNRGKKFCAGIALSVLPQGFLGIYVAEAVGMHPLNGIQIGTGALAGSVGTTSAFGPVYEAMGAEGATAIGVSAATLGMIIGSLTGGPIAVLLIRRYRLKSDPADQTLKGEGQEEMPLNPNTLLSTVCMMTIIAALGISICMVLCKIPYIEMPYFIGCLFAGAIARNVLEALGVDIRLPEVETVEHVSLDIFMAWPLILPRLPTRRGYIRPAPAAFSPFRGAFPRCARMRKFRIPPVMVLRPSRGLTVQCRHDTIRMLYSIKCAIYCQFMAISRDMRPAG